VPDDDEVAPVDPPSREEIIDKCLAEMTPMGYLNSEFHPWSAKRPIGRITVWPLKSPEGVEVHPSRQSMAVRCYMHPNCSFSRKRDRFTDRQLAEWLFSMPSLPDPSTPEMKQAAKAEHARLAGIMLRGDLPAAPADAGGGAGGPAAGG